MSADRDVLDELREAAARKWQGAPETQRAGLFARAADEIERLRAMLAPPAIPTGDAADSSWGEWQEASK